MLDVYKANIKLEKFKTQRFFFFPLFSPLQVVSPTLNYCQRDGGVELNAELDGGVTVDGVQKSCSPSVGTY